MRPNLLSRWSRLKRERGAAGKAREVDRAPPDADAAAEAEANDGAQQGKELTPELAEELNLPSIEAITGDTDIRSFLHSQVPADLTRAALRKAWTSDPAIRDFIGIADNQWDFNDPHAIPGFGPLRGGNAVRALLARTVGSETLAGLCAELPVPAEEEAKPSSARPDAAHPTDREGGSTTGRIEEQSPSGDRPRNA